MRLLHPPSPRNVRSLKGIGYVRRIRGEWRFSAWPRKRGPARSKHQQRAQDEFAALCRNTKLSTPQEFAAASALAKGTAFLPRDLLERAMVGMLSIIYLEDGTVLMGVRHVAPDAQLILDQLSTTPGSVIIRTDELWTAIDPGEPTQVLGIVSPGVVGWIDQSGGGGGAPPDLPAWGPPFAADFGVASVGSLTMTDVADRGLQLVGPAGGTSVSANFAARGSGDTRHECRIIASLWDQDTFTGFVFRDPSSGFLSTFGHCYDSSRRRHLQATAWTAPGSPVANYAFLDDTPLDLYLALEWNSTTGQMLGQASVDQNHWVTVFSGFSFVASPDQIGFGTWSTTTGGHGGVPVGLVPWASGF